MKKRHAVWPPYFPLIALLLSFLLGSCTVLTVAPHSPNVGITKPPNPTVSDKPPADSGKSLEEKDKRPAVALKPIKENRPTTAKPVEVKLPPKKPFPETKLLASTSEKDVSVKRKPARAGTRYVDSGLDAQPVKGDNSNLYLGNPSKAVNAMVFPENYLLDQQYYVQSYNAFKGIPNWVSWHLGSADIQKNADRRDDFSGFAGLDEAWYTVLASSYIGSGFDRGHNCPSADRSNTFEANSSTFLMTNMIPQAPRNNQQTWNRLEAYLRDEVKKGMEVYIVMGCYGEGGTGSNGAARAIDKNRVVVPNRIWKVALILPDGDDDLRRINTSTRIIAVDTPNDNGIDADWTKYIVTVRDIERATGYDLFSNLPKAIQEVLENQLDGGRLVQAD